MGEIGIRPYEECDRASVREICFATGYMGDPIAWQWRDAESFADMFTSYYTDREPESASVVELDGVVSGYLLGCVDSREAWNPAAVAGRHIVRRGIAFRSGTAGVIWRSVADGAVDVARKRVKMSNAEFHDPRWPAHLHIDLAPAARGRGVGASLMRGWLETLRERNVPGCHLGTWAENTGALAFFASQGFRRHGEVVPMPGMRSPSGERHHALTMVTDLTS